MVYSVLIFIVGSLMQIAAVQDTTLTLTSPAFQKGQPIPVKYTCDGQNISPEVHWTNIPDGTMSFALIMDDPDAGPQPWIHWVIFNIPAKQKTLHQNIPGKGVLESGALQGINDFNHLGYGGPCPPAGPPHQYVLTLYALDVRLHLQPGATKAQVMKAMSGHIIDKAVLKALYKRQR